MVMTLGIIIKFGKLPAGNSYGQLKLAHTPKKIPKQIFGGIPEFIIVIIIQYNFAAILCIGNRNQGISKKGSGVPRQVSGLK